MFNSVTNTMSPKLKIVYIIGRYPEISTTFIDREIRILQDDVGLEIYPISIRHPLTQAATLPEYDTIRRQTHYLTPVNYLELLWANLFFLVTRPTAFVSTLFYLLGGEHPSLTARITTMAHFQFGILTAFLLRNFKFDHLHAHFIDRAVVIALTVSRLLKRPYSLTAHANSIFVKRILIREKIDQASFAITVSEHNKAHLLNSYPDLEAEKIHILHPWVDTEQFVPAQQAQSNKTLRLLSVGRLVEKKGHHYLIEAAHRLKQTGIPFECRIVGDGPLYKTLSEKIIQYDLQDCVELMGSQPQTKVITLLREWADVFVLPCVIAKDGDRDGIPVSLAEAMAVGLPVVSTNIVGISELVKEGAGILVEAHNTTQLCDALHHLANLDTANRREMGTKGRKIVEKEFNLVAGTYQLAKFFEQSVNNHST